MVKVIAEFKCYETGETYESRAQVFADGAGYIDIKMLDECPDCGRHHWRNERGPIGT